MAKQTKNYIFAVGRRKSAVSRVRLYKGKGQTLINTIPINEYFGQVQSSLFSVPFLSTKTDGKYYATIKTEGGGKTAQLQSSIHGVARALVVVDPSFRLILKQRGLLTRDARTRERRKVGMGGKSRRKKQSPKR